MYEIYERGLNQNQAHLHDVDSKILLTHEQRTKARLKVTAENGEEVRLFLDHGKSLEVGEYLKTTCGKVVRVDGAIEPVARAFCDEWHTFARACYHLGNRHVKVQVGDLSLRMLPDHVLEEMLLGLGMKVVHEDAVFIPEHGAYHGSGSGHSHGHDHHEEKHSHHHGSH